MEGGKRRRREFRPEALEGRVLLSGFVRKPAGQGPPAFVAAMAAKQAARNNMSIVSEATARARGDFRLKPVDYINKQYAEFVADYAAAFAKYRDSVLNGGTGLVEVSQALAAPAAAASGLLTVTNAATFGAVGPTSPIGVTVLVNGQVEGSYLVNNVVGNSLVLSSGPSTNLPIGATVTATLPSLDNTAAILPSYVVERVNVMTQRIVTYFNRLPVQLPRSQGPLRAPAQRNAIQYFATQTLQGGSSESLLGSMLALPLPTPTPSAFNLYQQTFGAVIEQSRLTMLEGIRILFAGQALANNTTPVIPAGQA